MAKLAANILSTAKTGKHSDGGGLNLLIKGRDKKGRAKGSWVFRYTFLKQRYELGLGSVQAFSLAQARNECVRLRDLMTDKRNPINPIEEKRTLEAEARYGRKTYTLEELAPLAFEAIMGQLKDDGKAGRWYSPLEMYVLPKLGKMKVEEIHQRDIESTLKPIWRTKAPTAEKALHRLGIVMKHGAAMGLDINLNAVLSARQLLGHSGHIVRHHPALPWQDIPQLYQSLDFDNIVQRALGLYILTGGGMRLKPLRIAHADQISNGVWTIEGASMKGLKGKVTDFRVPITDEMQRLIDMSFAENVEGFLFPSPMSIIGRVKPISDQAIENVMRSKEKEWNWPEPYRPHGIRSTFRTWVSEINPSLYAVAETALAHKVGSKTERTYDRNDFLEQRRELKERWSAYLTGNSKEIVRIIPQSLSKGSG